MTTRVISAFPGTGKTYFSSVAKQKYKVIDLDTENYTLGYDDTGRVRNPDFPDNYTHAIKENLGKVDILLVGCQPEVVATLRKEHILFTLVYPKRGLKAEYVDRFHKRHSPQSFIDLLSRKWDLFLGFLEDQTDCEHVVLDEGQYISDVLDID